MFARCTFGFEDPCYNYLCDPQFDLDNRFTVTITPSSSPMAPNKSAPSPNNNFATPKNEKRTNRNGRSTNSFSPIDVDELEKSMLNGTDSTDKRSSEVSSSEIVNLIVDEELPMGETMDLLNRASYAELIEFFDSLKACRFLYQTFGMNQKFRDELSRLIRRSDPEVVYKIAVNPIGNFLLQEMVGVSGGMDDFICKTFIPNMHTLTMNKFGCRVVQTLIEKCEVPKVRELVEAILPFAHEAAINRNATHVLHCLCKNHNSTVFGKVVLALCNPVKLCAVAEDQFGCRVVQQILESLTQEITTIHVPEVFQPLVIELLTNGKRFASNKYANYLLQYFITESAFKRQRDYITDQIIVGNVISLSQDKFGSHVVEAALATASPFYLQKLCEEIFYDSQNLPKQLTALETMMFDQYGNYVVQRLLTIVIDVSEGRRQGDPEWLTLLAETVARNMTALQRYSSGKKIINTLRAACPSFSH